MKSILLEIKILIVSITLKKFSASCSISISSIVVNVMEKRMRYVIKLIQSRFSSWNDSSRVKIINLGNQWLNQYSWSTKYTQTGPNHKTSPKQNDAMSRRVMQKKSSFGSPKNEKQGMKFIIVILLPNQLS